MFFIKKQKGKKKKQKGESAMGNNMKDTNNVWYVRHALSSDLNYLLLQRDWMRYQNAQ